jgi:hypothetical protein
MLKPNTCSKQDLVKNLLRRLGINSMLRPSKCRRKTEGSQEKEDKNETDLNDKEDKERMKELRVPNREAGRNANQKNQGNLVSQKNKDNPGNKKNHGTLKQEEETTNSHPREMAGEEETGMGNSENHEYIWIYRHIYVAYHCKN